ncbi:MAG: hypothetical protein QXY45_03945 [Candidatus Aenigmatarchaeota archaeon]
MNIIKVSYIFLILVSIFSTGVFAQVAGIVSWRDAYNSCIKSIGVNWDLDTCWGDFKFALVGIPKDFWKTGSGSEVWLGIFRIIIPTLGIWMIVFGFMKELRIFKRANWVNTGLSFLIALSLWPAHLAYPLTNLLFQIIGIWSVIVFGVIFIAGAWLFGVIRRSEWVSTASVIQAEAETEKLIKEQKRELLEQKKMLIEKLATARGRELQDIQQKIDEIDKRLREVDQRGAALQGSSTSTT